MADCFDLYHIPQQSRRQKLRVLDQPLSSHHLLSCANTTDCELNFNRSAVSFLKESKFLKPAQQLLDEICDVGFVDNFDVGCGLMMSPSLVGYNWTSGAAAGGVHRSIRSTLISLLEEVYKTYKQCYRQIQAVIASFDTVAGASPLATLDLKAMYKHFCYINNAITEKLQLTNKPSYGQRAVNNTDHQPVWRPQRSLPKQAVTILRAWLFDHFLHPYPTDTEKQMLATQTGLSRNQVSNWFINARVRVWKPMVEEVHTLDQTRQHVTNISSETESSPLSSCPLKRDHNMMEGNKEDMNFYDVFSSINGTSANQGVSLTLGLHQNNNATIFPSSVGYEYMH